ncbi:hypothetical protein [Glycomyces terrestris]|uniref:Uncharacterized protein n=1 Tax=Glycomyces terrestris TaxID=2493553 RepID=A0A426V4W7_9ACTN|nr:hypothetical protein [Glycomyces terrestris]RRS01912.1 hypothetical protein EIW28_03985 [Glycomyces terrestris]
MDMTVVAYTAYLLVAVPLTVWVARTLGANGFHFIKDVFDGDEQLARAVNRLLQVGFYLLNFGFVALWLRTGEEIGTAREVFETVAVKIGAVLLVLGILHVLNVVVLNGFRRRGRVVDARALAAMEPPRPRPQGYGPHPQ